MNNKRRAMLKNAMEFLDRASDVTDNVLWDEEDSLDNIPENLQDTYRYSKMEDAVSNLESAIEYIEKARESMERASA